MYHHWGCLVLLDSYILTYLSLPFFSNTHTHTHTHTHTNIYTHDGRRPPRSPHLLTPLWVRVSDKKSVKRWRPTPSQLPFIFPSFLYSYFFLSPSLNSPPGELHFPFLYLRCFPLPYYVLVPPSLYTSKEPSLILLFFGALIIEQKQISQYNHTILL